MATEFIRLAEDVLGMDIRIPLDVVTQKLAWIGRSGSGKTYGAGKLAEGLLDHHIQTVILDPVGVWHGLRTSHDGKGKGYSIPVFGGEFGDIPLTPNSGQILANLIIEKEFSAVLDVSYMRKNERKQFVTDFAEQFFFLKKKNRTPVHIIMEEAQVFCPQRINHGEERMLGAIEDIVKLGRNYGIGISLISQRPQSVHKDCLNQTEALFTFQINAAHERKAIEDWVQDKGLSKETVVKNLSEMKPGSCFLWSPSWLRILKKIDILPKKTFDASQTPKVGNKIVSRELSPVNLEEIKIDMQSVIDQSNENNPAELRKKIKELTRQLEKKHAPVSNSSQDQEIKKLNAQYGILKNKADKIGESLAKKYLEIKQQVLSVIEKGEVQITKDMELLYALLHEDKATPSIKLPSELHENNFRRDNISKAPSVSFEELHGTKANPGIGKCERAILSVLAQRKGIFTSKSQLAILSMYSLKTSGFINGISKLRVAGFLTNNGGNLHITEHGLSILGHYDPMPTGNALHEYWYSKLGLCERKILSFLISEYPGETSKEALAENTGYSISTSGFINGVSKLRTLGLITGSFRDGNIKASGSLFE